MIAVVTVLAGALGAVARWLVARAFARSEGFPWAVLVVNVLGSAIAGAVLGLAERAAIGDDVRTVLLAGVCGGLTTFSTWSAETVQLVQSRRVGPAVLSVAANLVLGIGACAGCYLLTR